LLAVAVAADIRTQVAVVVVDSELDSSDIQEEQP
jgi:hypothetical protein